MCHREQWLHRKQHLDLRQWSLHWPARFGIMLPGPLYDRNDVSIEYRPSDLRRRGQRLHRTHHLELLGHRTGLRAHHALGVRRPGLGRVADAQ